MESLNIGILGFGVLARSLTDVIKRFPEYCADGSGPTGLPYAHIHMIYVNRETYAYGPNYVVPIEDKEGNGSRTYRDGLEALRMYETTVSFFEDWLLDHVSEIGDLNTVIDCTSYNEDSVELIFKIFNNSKRGLHFYTLNEKLMENHGKKLEAIAKRRGIEFYGNFEEPKEIVSHLRQRLDGGRPWEYKKFSEEFTAEAARLSKEAAERMKVVYLEQRKATMQERYADKAEPTDVVFFPLFNDPTDIKTITRFVINEEKHYTSKRTYDEDRKCLVVEHEMLDWYVGPYRVEDAVVHMFYRPDLKVTSARYLKYDSPKNARSDVSANWDTCPYVVKYFFKSDQAIGFTEKVSSLDIEEAIENSVEMLEFHLYPSGLEKPPNCECYDR